MTVNFNLKNYDIGGMNAIANDGQLTGDEVEKAKKDGWNVFDGFTEKDGIPSKKSNEKRESRLDVVVAKAINDAPKQEDGSISRKDALAAFIQICENHNGSVSNKTSNKTSEKKSSDATGMGHESSRYGDRYQNVVGYGYGYGFGYGYGYGFGYSGYLSDIKAMIDTFTDEDSPEGGKFMTRGEQQTLINAVTDWMNDLLGPNKK